MTITTPSRVHKQRPSAGGFTLLELLVGMSLGSLIMAGVLSTFLFLGRSGANLRNYSDMEAQARKALELFAEDTRQASVVTWVSQNSVILTIDLVSSPIVYTYSAGSFIRKTNSGTITLLTGITNFEFTAYGISGTAIADFYSTSTLRTMANNTTKQIQIALSASRRTQTVAIATNIVLSARYVLRNKRITA
jgi:prepilin-type N-terminal cleavage/methylation domain-containing protein